ncbi:YihY/virulence factor BrkB family protein [Cecembia calidifontis]|jgi:membrane protein|uniref:Membrane protein n=1 Tax=Cecembia calidifontis TaxID=1187080 RepID=A0A4Q7PC87_9BACT|nr:YihY/virulence factor BrkB family protein [Cecembia calidifontis]RZS97627.1 membrane protein [Cecembia calidifontis]
MLEQIQKYNLFKILKDSIMDFTSGESMNLAAATAFYTIFSLPALLLILLNIGATFLSQSEMKDEIMLQVEVMAGEESRATLEEVLGNYVASPQFGIAYIIAFLILAFSATTVFMSLQNAINHIWHIKAKPKKGILKYIINRLLGFLMVASIGMVMIASLILEAALVIISEYLTDFIGDINIQLFTIINFVVSQLVLVVIFALMFKILPDAKVRWKDTWLGAIITMVLFGIGKYLIGIYIANSDLDSTYGAAGSLAVLLVWIYYSLVIILFGGQLTYYLAEHVGGGVVPLPQAVKVELRELNAD